MSDDSSGCLVLLFIAGIIFLASSNESWVNSVWYAIEYNVRFNDVQTDARPRDCDFLTAPLGDKNCSYKAHVQVFTADGVLVAGDNAPTYASDAKTGKPIISYDGGKTWDWSTGPNLKPKFVRVFWVRE
jgi:hypothetical protein